MHGKEQRNYMRDKKNGIRIITEISEQKIAHMNEKKLENEEKYGKHTDLILVGADDRINYLSPKLFEEESKQKSYSYGYYERGSRVLDGKFAKGEFSEEEQRNFGITDLMNQVPEKYIKNLKEYPSYLEGRIYQMGKYACDFITQEGIILEEYINMMSIIYPEVNTQSFLKGYSDRKEEYKNKKGR